MFKEGDVVGRLSYNKDIIFIIKRINGRTAYLNGLYVRLVADSDISDLVKIEDKILDRYNQTKAEFENDIITSYKKRIGHITGKILHFDSDAFYLTKCLSLYKALGIYAYGVLLDENIMSNYVIEYIKKVKPNIIVITGHDSYNKKGLHDLNNYRNSINFIKTVNTIRDYYGPDRIFVYAGACGSNAEALIAAGANFVSSFDRKNIEAYDPAIVAIMASITPFNQIISIDDIYSFSKMEKGSIGGIESYGKMRLLLS